MKLIWEKEIGAQAFCVSRFARGVELIVSGAEVLLCGGSLMVWADIPNLKEEQLKRLDRHLERSYVDVKVG